MSTGSMFNGVCYPSQKAAALAACSSYNVFSGDGSRVRCSGTNEASPYKPLSTTEGGFINAALTVARYDTDASLAWVESVGITLQPCERYDYEYWSPVIGAWVTALVAILAARVLYLRVFSRETL